MQSTFYPYSDILSVLRSRSPTVPSLNPQNTNQGVNMAIVNPKTLVCHMIVICELASLMPSCFSKPQVLSSVAFFLLFFNQLSDIVWHANVIRVLEFALHLIFT